MRGPLIRRSRGFRYKSYLGEKGVKTILVQHNLRTENDRRATAARAQLFDLRRIRNSEKIVRDAIYRF